MGVRYQTQAEGITYTVVDDLQVTYLALITSSLVDEVTGTPLQVEAVIRPDLPATGINLGDNALFAVTGYVELVFPKLAMTPYTVNLKIAAPGYRPATVTVPIPAGSVLPVVFPPIKMRPLPVRVQGRVVKQSDRSPIIGAVVSSGDNTILLLRSPLYFDHLAPLTITAFTFNPVPPLRNLAIPVTGGSNTIFLNNNAGLGPNDTLQIGPDPAAELAEIQTLGPGAGQVNLKISLNSSFPAGTPAQQMNPAGGGSATLARTSNAGDGLLVLAAPLAAAAIQVVDGAQSEYHLLNALTDSSGYYHLNGLAGVSSLNFLASAGGFTTASATWFLVYNDPVNVVDFRLKP